jgi:hypothetical protein
MLLSTPQTASTYIHQLFPHHWSAILAENIPGVRPEWKTLQYKIQASELDRLYESPSELIGVRFGKTTKYALIDIDKYSPYHPEVSKSEWDRLLTTLEDVGLIDKIIVQSSFSKGLHIYLWFPQELPTFDVAQLLWATFTANGFSIRSGDLETFPNAKVYTPIPSLYAAHRLPLQPHTGSILLDEYLDEIQTRDQRHFFCYRASNPQQDMDLVRKKIIWAEKYFKKHRLQKTGLGTSATDWKRCLDERLKLGWTESGQTNEILRTACVRSWVFGYSSDVDAVHQVVLETPGYREHCQHQDEIIERLQDWMMCVMKRYYPYGRPDLAGQVGDSLSVVPANLTERVRPRSTVRQNNVLERLRGVVGAIVESAIELPGKIGDLVLLLQEKAQELYGTSFGINTLYSSKYEPEWRVLVEEVEHQSEQELSHVYVSLETEEKKRSNPVSKSTFSHFCSMKVCFFLRIRLSCTQFIFKVFISCFNSLQSFVEFSTSQSRTESELQIVQEDGIEENLISFTYGNMPVSAEKISINKTDELESPGVGQPIVESTEEDDDAPFISVGDYLRRIPFTTGTQHYPALVAKVVREGRFGWELICAEGKSWRCPFNMLGQGWEPYSSPG